AKKKADKRSVKKSTKSQPAEKKTSKEKSPPKKPSAGKKVSKEKAGSQKLSTGKKRQIRTADQLTSKLPRAKRKEKEIKSSKEKNIYKPSKHAPVITEQTPPMHYMPMIEPKEIYIDRGLPLPQRYNEDRLTAMVKDPNWIFAYWELTGPRKEEVMKQYGSWIFKNAVWVLRIHDCAASFWTDINIDINAENWYIPVTPDTQLKVEIGLITDKGEFISFACSRELHTPRSQPSSEVSEDWFISDKNFQEFLKITYPEGTSGLSSLELAQRVKDSAAHFRHLRG
ncbi:MAG: DUF4912 domain-containing protein, partial [Planctomycetota bacterium]